MFTQRSNLEFKIQHFIRNFIFLKSVPLLFIVILPLPLTSMDIAVEPTDSRIKYVGRWDFTDSSLPWCTWQGSSIKARFQGTAIRGKFEIAKPEYVRIIVDEQTKDSKKIMLSPEKRSYVLADNLAPGEHSVEIVKETYANNSRLKFHGFLLDGKGLLNPSINKTVLKIAFYGDSNLAGSSLEHEKNNGDPSLRGSYYSFAGIASRMLAAEYQNISVGGAKIASGLNSGLSFYNRMDFYEPEPKWDPSRFPADICVINLGANDINAKSKGEIKKDYIKLIKAIRDFHPAARIVLMNGYGWSRDEPANYTDEVVEEINDDNLSRLVFPWLFNEWHGCEYDHVDHALSAVGLLHDFPRAHLRLGVTLARLDQFAQAVVAFETCLKLAPLTPAAHRWLAYIFESKLHRPDQAIGHRLRLKKVIQQIKQLESNDESTVDPIRKMPATNEIPATKKPVFAATKSKQASNPNQIITIVTGLPRSGTSMMMQMLVAGGMAPLTDGHREADDSNPKGYFEYDKATKLGTDSSWIGESKGKAVKIVAQLLTNLPSEIDGQPANYRIVFMERNLDEILASQYTMLNYDGRTGANLERDRLAKIFNRDLEKIYKFIDQRRISCLVVEHALVIKDPNAAAQNVNKFFNHSLDTEAMAAVVDPALYRQRNTSN